MQMGCKWWKGREYNVLKWVYVHSSFQQKKNYHAKPWNIQSTLATMDHTEFAQMNISTLRVPQSGGTAISFVQELDRQWNL